MLYARVLKLPTDKTFCIEHGILGVPCCLILGCITNQPLIVGEGNIGGSCGVTHIILNNLDLVVDPGANARVGCA